MKSLFFLLLFVFLVIVKGKEERELLYDHLTDGVSQFDKFKENFSTRKLDARETENNAFSTLMKGTPDELPRMQGEEGRWSTENAYNNPLNINPFRQRIRTGKAGDGSDRELMYGHLTNGRSQFSQYEKDYSTRKLNARQRVQKKRRPVESQDFTANKATSLGREGRWKQEDSYNNPLNEAAVGAGEKKRKSRYGHLIGGKSQYETYEGHESTQDLQERARQSRKKGRTPKTMSGMRASEKGWQQQDGYNNAQNQAPVGDSSTGGLNNNLFLAVCLMVSLGAGYYVGKRQKAKNNTKYEILNNENQHDKNIEMSYQTAAQE